MRLALKVLTLVAFGLVVVPSGAAGPRWGTPVVIAPAGGQPSAFDHPHNPDVGMNERGDVSVVWGTFEGQFANGSSELKERARKSGARDWSAPVNVAQASKPGCVRVDAAGDATVVYWAGYVRAADRAASAAQWLTNLTLSPRPYGYVAQMSVDMNDRGDAVVAWSHDSVYPDPNELVTSVRVDGVWSAPVSLPVIDKDVFFTAAAIDSAGNALVIWIDGVKIRSAFRPKQSGTWRPPAEIGVADRYDELAVGFDAVGNATALWGSSSAYRPFGGTWGMRALVPGANRWNRLAVCGNGDAVVLSLRWSSSLIGAVPHESGG